MHHKNNIQKQKSIMRTRLVTVSVRRENSSSPRKQQHSLLFLATPSGGACRGNWNMYWCLEWVIGPVADPNLYTPPSQQGRSL